MQQNNQLHVILRVTLAISYKYLLMKNLFFFACQSKLHIFVLYIKCKYTKFIKEIIVGKLFSFIVSLFMIAFLTQGFQCSSPEMTTAKIAIQQNDFKKAETYLDKELAKNPTNGEALLYMSQVKLSNNDIPSAYKAITEADKYLVDEKLKQSSLVVKNAIWKFCYSAGIEAFNQGLTSNNKKVFEGAANLFKIGSAIKPGFADFYQLIGSSYDAMGDTNSAVEYYSKYMEILEPEISLAKEKRIFVGLGRKEVINALGTPAASKGFKYEAKGDSNIIDNTKLGTRDIYSYFSEKKGDKNFKITGWRVNPPKEWLQSEKEQPIVFFTSAFSNLAQIYYARKQYEKAINSVKAILAFDPTNTDANSFIVSVYEEMGQKDEATKYISTLVQSDPQNKFYKATYGDILLKMGNYDEAIKQYEEALKIDPKFEEVNMNLAVGYKNKVFFIQKRQQEEITKNPAMKLNVDEYAPYLKKSAEYYESARKQARFSRNFQVLAELAEIYYVLNDLDRLKVTVAELESFEAIVDPKEKEQYYLRLIKIYDKYLRNADKLKQAQDQLEALGK